MFDFIGLIIDMVTTIFDREHRKALLLALLTLLLSAGLALLVYNMLITTIIK